MVLNDKSGVKWAGRAENKGTRRHFRNKNLRVTGFLDPFHHPSL
jgi:hypothetical protein